MAKTNKNHAGKNTKPSSKARISAVGGVDTGAPAEYLQPGAGAARDFMEAGAREARRSQETLTNYGREQAEKFSQSAEQAMRSFGESASLTQEQVEAAVESGKIATDLSKELYEEWANDLNALFSQNLELAKDALSCRTLNDVMEVQSRLLQNNMFLLFDQGTRMTNAWLKLVTDASEPLAQQAATASQRFGKSLAA